MYSRNLSHGPVSLTLSQCPWSKWPCQPASKGFLCVREAANEGAGCSRQGRFWSMWEKEAAAAALPLSSKGRLSSPCSWTPCGSWSQYQASSKGAGTGIPRAGAEAGARDKQQQQQQELLPPTHPLTSLAGFPFFSPLRKIMFVCHWVRIGE